MQNDITRQVLLAAADVEKSIDKRAEKTPFKSNHVLYKTFGSKSAIGEFGEALFRHMDPDNYQSSDSSKYDAIHRQPGKCEIKTAKTVNKNNVWFNQIRFNKGWDALVIIQVKVDEINACYAENNADLQQWKCFMLNNDYSFNGDFNQVIESGIFRKLFAGSYRWQIKR